MDPAHGKELVDRAEELVAQDLPALPLYYTDSYMASNDKVRYYYTSAVGAEEGVPIALNKMIFVEDETADSADGRPSEFL